jgi:peptidoglycan hydrolase-like protein with peptidoglycan-binding domain
MNPGPIDGKYGPLTKGAETQFESTYRVGVSWHSRAFRRFIIDRASTRVKTLNDASR